MNYPIKAFQELVEQLHRLPGVGPKTAERLAIFFLNMEPAEAKRVALAIDTLHERVKRCPECYNLSDGGKCNVCTDPRRDSSILLVVEEARDVLAIERAGSYNGMYHVLGGTIRLAAGVGPEKLNIASLIRRVKEKSFEEVILATNLTHEGNLTALYIQRELSGVKCRITRIASGIPMGTELEFADDLTLSQSIRRRVPLDDDKE
ncbi:MAG TPA: recombination mediator RecR [Caldisericia bacterium]|nr:recombination mediator RecR [Caldisericia bacterium]HPF49119.1 recombination mediator RecR [Caldisericia bacterium]HPI83017.1 recombination mediator RecR [Caldisericia bacterium]HPQ92244.1 recombination mediator RecR [Caldisericia bacterium]HRV74658.1 recombination mediator RecR [Caldisericia bacterium]